MGNKDFMWKRVNKEDGECIFDDFMSLFDEKLNYAHETEGLRNLEYG